MSSLFGIGGGGNVGASGSFYPYSIDQSLRFEESGAANLTFTPSNNGTDNKKFTYSVWIKRGQSSADDQHLIQSKNAGSGTGQGQVGFFLDTSDSLDVYTQNGGANPTGTRLLRDHSGWYHCCFVYDTTEATASDRVKVYINGDRDTLSGSFPPLNSVMSSINYNGQEQYIGKYVAGYTRYFNGYMAEIHMVDGQALSPTDFAEEVNGIWVPKQYVDNGTTSHGVNGYHLDFADSANIGNDVSGNNNDWTANNLAASDVMSGESPTNNFPVLIPGFTQTTQEGGLKLKRSSTGNLHTGCFSTMGVSSGKWYVEIKYEDSGIDTVTFGVAETEGGFDPAVDGTAYVETSGISSNLHMEFATWSVEAKLSSSYAGTLGSAGSYGSSPSSGDIIQIALDMDDKKIWYGVNGTYIASGDPANGTNASQSGSAFNPTGEVVFVASAYLGRDFSISFNFGQDSANVSSANSDENGIGTFEYAPPSGFLALCSANLPEPTIGPNSAEQANDYFSTVLWTGDNTASRAITNVGHAPDFVWIKTRNQANEHSLFDSVRGVAKDLESNSTAAEQANNQYGYINSFDSDGFTVVKGTNSNPALVNASGNTYTAWNWKADGTAVSNTDGSITSQVSAAPDAGFSIVGFTSTGNTETVGHGLSQAPELYIRKSRTNAENWVNFFTVVDGTLDFMNFNTTNAASGSGASLPTSTVFSIGGGETNGETHVCYCFHSVEGFSKVGKYVGNGSTDGTFVYTGFRPAWIMTKRTDTTSNWLVIDVKRDIDNVAHNRLIPNKSNTEATSVVATMDILSNGFKRKDTNADVNANNGDYIYLAFAEQPFKYANAR